MNKETHKTIRVFATKETDFELDINVPINLNNDEIWQFIRDGNIDESELQDYSGGWTWRPHFDMEFDPKAADYSKEILES